LRSVLSRRIPASLRVICYLNERGSHAPPHERACRGDAGRIHRNAALIGLLLAVPAAEVAIQLTGEAKLLASGLLRFGDDGALSVLERLVSLIHRDTLPGTDIYDQPLGTTAAGPLPWEAFAHLGREAEVAATVLFATLSRRESGINILLYGAPGTGKTSFASTLAAHIGTRLRPVAETDEDGGEPDRASLRRFLVKVCFDWLTQAQARLAFRRSFGLAAPAPLDDLRTLMPADFSLVRRQAAMRGGEPDPVALLRLLAAEYEGRIGERLPVGFGRPDTA
jgi:hypothetical protein